jgi:hypothetical protein
MLLDTNFVLQFDIVYTNSLYKFILMDISKWKLTTKEHKECINARSKQTAHHQFPPF